ncbi:MAG: amidase family protein, partial [Bacilli bacterium]
MYHKTIKDLHEDLITNKTSIKTIYDHVQQDLKQYQNKHNAINNEIPYEINENIINLLSGIPCAIKDNINIKGIKATSSSSILENYEAVHDASIISKLKSSNAMMIATTNLDQFGMGGNGLNSIYGPLMNPLNNNIPSGGSSSGSAALVASGLVSYAIGSDTGDSIRKPAAYCGVYGYKPTWSTISRYGMMPYASSLDTVGVIARSIEDLSIVAQELNGPDYYDTITLINKQQYYYDNLKINKKLKVGYIKELVSLFDQPNVINTFTNTINLLQQQGIEVVECSFNKALLQQIRPLYTLISNAEATSNLANLTGVAFGNRIEDENVEASFRLTREKGFTQYTKARLAIGAKVLHVDNKERYYKKALKTRTDFINAFKDIFNEVDILIAPALNDIDGQNNSNASLKDYIITEDYMASANIIGAPS